MDPRGVAKLDYIADLIARGIQWPNPVVAGIIRADLGASEIPGAGGQATPYVTVEVGNRLVRAAYLPPIPIQVDHCCFAVRLRATAGSPWVVLATNYQVPLPPPIQVGFINLFDQDPGPDGIWGTGDDDPGGEGEFRMVDDDGRVLVEYS